MNAERGEVQPLDLLDLDRVIAGASRHHDDDRIRRDAPRHHEQRLPRGGVHPVQILADDEQRMPSRRVREQGERSHPGEEGRRRLTVPHAEGDIERVALRLRQLGNAVAQGAQQQVQTGEGRRGLVRSPGGAQHPHSLLAGATLELVDERGLADAGVALDEQRRPAGAEARAARGEQRQFGLASDEFAIGRHS